MKSGKIVRLITIVVFLAGICCFFGDVQNSVWAEEVAQEVVTDVEAVEIETEVEATQEPVQLDGGEEEFDLYFKDGSTVRSALRMLSLKYHKNIIPSSKVQGKLNSTTIFDLTFEDALNAILGHEFKYEQEGNFIRVYTKDEYKKLRSDVERMECKVFTVYYISTEEAARLIVPVLSENAIVQTSSMPEEALSSGDSVDVKEGGISSSQFDTLVIKDYPENLEAVEDILRELDQRPVQVLVEATILSAKLTEGMELGVDLSLLNGGSIDSLSAIGSGLPGAMVETSNFASTVTGGVTALKSSGLKIGVSSGNVAAFINALETVTDTTILANPKILALNKQVGTVFIGQKEPYRSSSSVSGSGVATEGEVNFLDTGTKLSFRPYVGKNGYIRMDIYPKDSTSTPTSIDVPEESTAELSSNIMVKDGETIVIGGMFRDEISTTKSQVPLLGDLPFIGAAFRNTSDNTEKKEVIILLTCHIINEPKETQGELRHEDVRRKRFGAIDGLQSIGVAKISEGSYRRALVCYENGDLDRAMIEIEDSLFIRPTYLEAIRLKEKILEEINPDAIEKLDRKLAEKIEEPDTAKWQRR